MPHVTFIHGMSNKPPKDDLLRIWKRTLADAAEPLPLADLGVTSEMAYWADLLYPSPDDDLTAYEGVREDTADSVAGAAHALLPAPRTPEEAAFIEGLRAKLTRLSDTELESNPPPVPATPQGGLERVPLPWFMKKRFLAAYLRDVHHYLFDVEFAPPGRPPAHVRQAVRARLLDALNAPGVTRPHVVVSHSLGTVVAYDCLKNVADCASVDGLITIGSPLGLDEVQDKLAPGWSRNDGFPGERLAGGWVNLFDRLDPVCGFDARLRDDFRRGGQSVVDDVDVQNDGAWRHSATKYVRQPAFVAALRRLLGV